MNVADGLHSSDRVILPPPPEAIAGANGPNGSALSPEELARLNNGELPEVEPLRKAPAGSVDGLVTVHFAFDSYELDEGAKQTLEQNLQWMSTHPGVQILVEGHCDERGTQEYNMNLGQRRANSVKNFLVQRGVPESILHTISYGEERPIDTAGTEGAMAKNRRAQFLVY
ncbi:peptidoglycan-associated lipoprotein Pal [Candidatus Sumerlaeota bacterium]|nr:peptidoglycan-associated lipoprotein Pal [Candidatus Sumerlaeota bacterium]